MTLPELKAEADKLGYKVVKKSEPYTPLLPCICGCKRREHWVKYAGNNKYETTLLCMRCNRKASGLSQTAARKAWNKMIGELRDQARS